MRACLVKAVILLADGCPSAYGETTAVGSEMSALGIDHVQSCLSIFIGFVPTLLKSIE